MNARLIRALERIALIRAKFDAHQVTAEAAAYEAGEVAVAELMRRTGHSERFRRNERSRQRRRA